MFRESKSTILHDWYSISNQKDEDTYEDHSDDKWTKADLGIIGTGLNILTLHVHDDDLVLILGNRWCQSCSKCNS
jgi:hypothetical protein